MKKNNLAIEILLLAVVLLTHAIVVVSPQNQLLNWFQTDDAFYYFKVAQNAAEGKGLTFDGLNPTNGFHPLWMAICIPIFYLARFNLFLPLRILVFIMALLNAFTGLLLYRLFSRFASKELGWLVAVFWMFYPVTHYLTTMLGMETGVNAFSIILMIYLVANFLASPDAHKKEWQEYFYVGLSALLVLFSRLDNIFFVLVMGTWLVLRGTSLRWQILLDFMLINLIALFSYFWRLQSTDNLFNYLPFAYFLFGSSIILKPAWLYLFGSYQLSTEKPLIRRIGQLVIGLSIASIMTTGLIFLLFDMLHIFSGYSRMALLMDWVLSVVVLGAVHLMIPKIAANKEIISFQANWKTWLGRAVAYFLPLGAGLGIYMLWNLSYAGSALPISGVIKRWWGTLPNAVYGAPSKTLAEILGSWFSPSLSQGPWAMVIQPVHQAAQAISQLITQDSQAIITVIDPLLWLVLIILVIWLVKRHWEWIKSKADELSLLPLFTGCFIGILSYKGSGYLHTRYWYWIAEMLLITISAGLLLECVFREWRKHKKLRNLPAGMSVASSLLLIVFMMISTIQQYSPDPGSVTLHAILRETDAVRQNTSPGSVIGMTGGGVIAYFIQDRVIVNLDGLVNNKVYFEQLKTGNADQYFKSVNMRYVYGAPSMLLDSDPYRWVLEGHLMPIKKFGDNTLYSYRSEKNSLK